MSPGAISATTQAVVTKRGDLAAAKFNNRLRPSLGSESQSPSSLAPLPRTFDAPTSASRARSAAPPNRPVSPYAFNNRRQRSASSHASPPTSPGRARSPRPPPVSPSGHRRRTSSQPNELTQSSSSPESSLMTPSSSVDLGLYSKYWNADSKLGHSTSTPLPPWR